MVVNDYLTCPLAVHSTDFGIIEDVDIVRTDEASDVVSLYFNVQILKIRSKQPMALPSPDRAARLPHVGVNRANGQVLSCSRV